MTYWNMSLMPAVAAVRWASRGKAQQPDVRSDLKPMWPPLNAALAAITHTELALSRSVAAAVWHLALRRRTQMNTTRPALSIVVPLYNSASTLPMLIDGLSSIAGRGRPRARARERRQPRCDRSDGAAS